MERVQLAGALGPPRPFPLCPAGEAEGATTLNFWPGPKCKPGWRRDLKNCGRLTKWKEPVAKGNGKGLGAGTAWAGLPFCRPRAVVIEIQPDEGLDPAIQGGQSRVAGAQEWIERGRASAWHRHPDTGPAAELGVGLSAVVDRAFSGDQGAGLEGVPNGCLLRRDARPEQAMVRPGREAIRNDRRAGVFGNGRRHERLVNAHPATNLLVRFLSIEGRTEERIEPAGLEGAKDGFFLGGNACRSEASVRSHRKVVPSVFGFHPSGRFAGLEFVEHAPYPVDFTSLDDL